MPLAVSSVSDYEIERERWVAFKKTMTARDWAEFDADFKCEQDLALELVQSGKTAWHIPYFYADISDAIQKLYGQWKFEIARFVATFLIETLPSDPLDSDIGDLLFSIREGTKPFPPFESYCRYPNQPEYYCKTLNWKMIPLAEEGIQYRRAQMNAGMVLMGMGRGKECLDSMLPENMKG